MSCYVSRQIDDYAHRIGMAESLDMAIGKRAAELMDEDGECEPLEPNNFSESIGAASELELNRACYLLKSKRYEEAGKLFVQIASEYQLSIALKKAEKELKESSFFD